VFRLVVMRRRMSTARRIATADMTAYQAHAEVDPCPSEFQALLAARRQRRHGPNLIKKNKYVALTTHSRQVKGNSV
jgi:hypothetical protein